MITLQPLPQRAAAIGEALWDNCPPCSGCWAYRNLYKRWVSLRNTVLDIELADYPRTVLILEANRLSSTLQMMEDIDSGDPDVIYFRATGLHNTKEE